MITAQNLVAMYDRNVLFIKQLTEGLTHADSLVQPPVSGNCMNWVLGHLTVYRNRISEILGQPLVIDPAVANRYVRESKPVTGDEPGLGQLPQLVAAIEASQAQLAEHLPKLSAEAAQEMRTYGTLSMSTAEWFLFLLRHEAYHVGNLELPRELALAARKTA